MVCKTASGDAESEGSDIGRIMTTRWHYHRVAGNLTIVRPSDPVWPGWTPRPLCKTKGYELYLTARVEQVTCRRCLHLMADTRENAS